HMLARDEPALAVARVAVCVLGRAAEDADGARLLLPFHHAIVWNVAPQEIAPVTEPDRAFAPAKAGRKPLYRREREVIARETGIEDLNRGIRIARGRCPRCAFVHTS